MFKYYISSAPRDRLRTSSVLSSGDSLPFDTCYVVVSWRALADYRHNLSNLPTTVVPYSGAKH